MPAPSLMPPQRLAEVGGAAHERHGERELVDVMGLVGRASALALVDEVDAERLEDLASTKWPMRALAMHRDVTDALIDSIISGSLIRATPPSRRMSAGTRSRAITAQAPESSAILACSPVTTSMMTPPFNISARPRLTG
jgi:hypothetical protein